MNGTFPYCHTKEAIKRMEDGNIILHLSSEIYFKKSKKQIHSSLDGRNWELYEQPLITFPIYEEWRSLSNLHYYEDLVESAHGKPLKFLTTNDKMVDETHPKADKLKMRWFIDEPLS